MWFSLGFKNYIVKKIINNECCEIFVCDFIRIWHKLLSNEELFSISQSLNPLFEASTDKLKEVTLKLLEKDEKTQKEIIHNEKDLTLKLESNKMGVKFYFQVNLTQGDEEMLYKEFTFPLFLTMMKLENREKKLIKIIKSKDEEIQEYKQEFGEIKTSYAITNPFNEEEFCSKESISPFISSPSSFWDFCYKSDKQLKVNQEEENLINESEIHSVNHNICDKTQSVFKDKNVGAVSDYMSCVKLNHEIIKRRKKQKGIFKMKF